MIETPDTRLSLLQRVRDPQDQAAWQEFVQIYEPLIYRLARRRGLQDADAREVTQDVLITVSRAIGDWEPTAGKGSFRSWLFRIAKNLTINVMIRQSRIERGTGDSNIQALLREHPDTAAGDTSLFDEEYRRQVFRAAADAIRSSFQEKTWQAFWQTCVEGQSIPQVAAELEMGIGSVYAARSRITAKLNEQIRQMNVEP